MIRAILALCSCDRGHAAMYRRLEERLAVYRVKRLPWEWLVEEAERQGVAPLLHKHLRSIGFAMPAVPRRQLQGLSLRSRRAAMIRNGAVAEILRACARQRLAVLAVKGIALGNFAYSEAGLRPMRDVDLLVRRCDLKEAADLLSDSGYRVEAAHKIPADYYHLAPLQKTIDGLRVSIELHHNLLPFQQQYPRWPMEKAEGTAMTFDLDGIGARTLGLEDTLWYVYLHGLQAPLSYEPFRLIHVADLVTLVEKFSGQIDWRRLQETAPTYLNVLSCLHHLTPWTPHIAASLRLDTRTRPGGAGRPYAGWPQRTIASAGKGGMINLLRETMWPSPWWTAVYYGQLRGSGYLKARLFDHPRNVWRWVKAYCLSYLRKETRETGA